MKLRHILTGGTLALLTAVSSGTLAPDVLAGGRDSRYDRHDRYPRYDRHGPPRHHPGPPRYRPGPWRPRGYGYGYPYFTDDAFKYLGITAVALGFLDLLNADQQRRHEAALAAAASSPPGETIVWQSGGASGSVQTTRIGTGASGRQCREFQQTVTVGGRTEQAYGTACLQPDGSWQIVDTR